MRRPWRAQGPMAWPVASRGEQILIPLARRVLLAKAGAGVQWSFKKSFCLMKTELKGWD